MRISDWSSDVCSSDLLLSKSMGQETLEFRTAGYSETHGSIFERAKHTRSISTQVSARNLMHPDEIMRMGPDEQLLLIQGDRTSVVSGKRVSVRVDPGGRRITQKKTIQPSLPQT